MFLEHLTSRWIWNAPGKVNGLQKNKSLWAFHGDIIHSFGHEKRSGESLTSQKVTGTEGFSFFVLSLVTFPQATASLFKSQKLVHLIFLILAFFLLCFHGVSALSWFWQNILWCKEAVLVYESHIFLIIFVRKLETDHRRISSNGLPVTFLQDWAVVVADTLTHIDKLKKKRRKLTSVSRKISRLNYNISMDAFERLSKKL